MLSSPCGCNILNCHGTVGLSLAIKGDKLGLSCAKLRVVWLGLKLSFEFKIEDVNVRDE